MRNEVKDNKIKSLTIDSIQRIEKIQGMTTINGYYCIMVAFRFILARYMAYVVLSSFGGRSIGLRSSSVWQKGFYLLTTNSQTKELERHVSFIQCMNCQYFPQGLKSQIFGTFCYRFQKCLILSFFCQRVCFFCFSFSCFFKLILSVFLFEDNSATPMLFFFLFFTLNIFKYILENVR